MSNAIVNYSMSDLTLMGAAIAKSGLFGIKTQDQAIALCLIAQAEGMHPALAARDYHVIQGRPALKADAMLARFQTAGGKVEWKTYTDKEVTGKFSHPQGGVVEISWTIEMANAAKLTGKDVWKQYPRQMLRARVISEGIRTIYPGVAVGVYTPEEVQDFDNGKIIEAEPITATTGDVTPKQAYGSVKAMKVRFAEIQNAINAGRTGEQLSEVKHNYREDFVLMQKVDAQLYDSLNALYQQRLLAIRQTQGDNEEEETVEDGALTPEEEARFSAAMGDVPDFVRRT